MPPPASDADKSAGPNVTATPPVNAAETTPAAPSVVAEPAPAEPTKPPKEQAEDKLITELPSIAVSGRQWLKKLPEDSFVIAHKSFGRIKDAQAFIRGKDYLANARIAPVYTEGKDEARFVVLTGFFRSKDRAKTTIGRLGLPAEASVVPVATALSQSAPKKSKP